MGSRALWRSRVLPVRAVFGGLPTRAVVLIPVSARI